MVANVRRVVDYESLYNELQRKLDEQHQREHQQQLDMDKQYESIEQQETTIDALRDEIKILTAQNEQLKAQSYQDKDNDMKKYIDDAAEQSALELNNMKVRYEKRITAYKAAANEAQQEISELQYDIRSEREKHLATLKDLNLVNERYSESERAFEYRIQELLAELEEAKNSNNDQAKLSSQLEEKDLKISELEEKIYILEEKNNDDMVSRETVEEMEKMFTDTVEQLVKRVSALEGKSSSQGKASASSNALNDSDDDEMAYLDQNVGPSLRKNRQATSQLPPAAPVRNTNVRFEPGKVRATGNGSSHHIGGNFGSKGNVRRY